MKPKWIIAGTLVVALMLAPVNVLLLHKSGCVFFQLVIFELRQKMPDAFMP